MALGCRRKAKSERKWCRVKSWLLIAPEARRRAVKSESKFSQYRCALADSKNQNFRPNRRLGIRQTVPARRSRFSASWFKRDGQVAVTFWGQRRADRHNPSRFACAIPQAYWCWYAVWCGLQIPHDFKNAAFVTFQPNCSATSELCQPTEQTLLGLFLILPSRSGLF